MFCGFDLETEGDQELFALQPWRVLEGSARITLSSAYYQGKSKVVADNHGAFVQELRELNVPIVGHNIIFDLAFLYASGIDISGIPWVDSMLLWKFLDNGQEMPMSWTLKSGVKKFLKDWPHQKEFLAMKEEELPDPSDPYWLRRVSFDAQATAMIADIIWTQLTPQQQNLAKIQAVSLPAMAASWVNGIRIDLDAVKKARPKIISDMLIQEEKLGLVEPGSCEENYTPSKILRSPAKMRKLLYEDYGLVCTRFTDKGAKSADRTALTYLSDIDDRVQDILIWRQHNTILSKFIESPLKACKYLKSNVTHAAPRVFATYTGRLSYSSKIKKHHAGLSAHQLPRGKVIRQYILPYPGDVILELDAKSQEGRLMAIVSGDEQMKNLFRAKPPYDDAHSFIASKITGESFEEFLKRKAAKDPQAVIDRNAGKFTGLAYNYRSSPATARRIARVQYGIDVDIDTTTKWKQIFMEAYPAIPMYWKSAPIIAKGVGYAETLAGARYKISRWRDKDWVWSSASSAINYRVQGSGADMKYLAMAVLFTQMPELAERFLLDLHDGLHFSIPKNWAIGYAQKINWLLDSIDYKKYWGVDIDIPLSWEATTGYDEGTKFEINYDVDGAQTFDQFIKSR